MLEKWSQIINKVQRYFFGYAQENEPDTKTQRIHRQPANRQTANRNRDRVKVFHQYPKGGNFRFPLNVEEEKRVLSPRNQVERKRQQRHRPEEGRPLPPRSLNEKQNSSSAEREEAKKRYFSSKDFSVTDVPSPVYGFQTRREISQPFVEEETLDTHAQSIVDIQEIKETPPTTELESQKVKSNADENKNRIFDEENRHQAQEEVAATVTKNKNEQFLTGHQESKQKRWNPKGLPSLQERKRDQLPKREMEEVAFRVRSEGEKKKSRNKKPKASASSQAKVPYNVMMTPFDRWKQEWRNEREQSSISKQPHTYRRPALSILAPAVQITNEEDESLQLQRKQLEETLHHFQVNATVTEVTEGPSIRRFEIQPAPGVKVNKITNLNDDLKLAMAAEDLRMEAPIPGKNAIGIEVPKQNRTPVLLRDIFEKDAFKQHASPLAVALGLDIAGSPVVMNLGKMPHGLIAGATGSGKSVCINSILLSVLYKANPDEVKLLLIDPKIVELAPYKDIPHLAAPVVNDPKEATTALKWGVSEMERRYQQFAAMGVRNIEGFNKKSEENMPYLVIVIDELADLMMVSPQDVEDSICRIAQKARACGIHLLVATQRPSVDVITGLIKANIPTRIAFSVSSMADSRTILDTGGAERLIGKGDMLLSENGASKVVRLQGTYVSDEEIDGVTDFLREQQQPHYLYSKEEAAKTLSRSNEDELLEEVCQFVVQQGNASTSLVQRRFHIGYNRAARLMDVMESKGIISEAAGTKPRRVLIGSEEVQQMFEH